MDSMKTLGDFLQKLHNLWDSPLEGLSLKAPLPGYVVMYKHLDSMTCEAVIVEKVRDFQAQISHAKVEKLCELMKQKAEEDASMVPTRLFTHSPGIILAVHTQYRTAHTVALPVRQDLLLYYSKSLYSLKFASLRLFGNSPCNLSLDKGGDLPMLKDENYLLECPLRRRQKREKSYPPIDLMMEMRKVKKHHRRRSSVISYYENSDVHKRRKRTRTATAIDDLPIDLVLEILHSALISGQRMDISSCHWRRNLILNLCLTFHQCIKNNATAMDCPSSTSRSIRRISRKAASDWVHMCTYSHPTQVNGVSLWCCARPLNDFNWVLMPLELDISYGIGRLGVSHGALRISQISRIPYGYFSDPVLCVWEFKDKGEEGGKWCLEHQLYVNQMVSEKSPWLTKFVVKRHPIVRVLAFHPNDRDIIYLMIHLKVVSCNLRRKTLEVVRDLPDPHSFTDDKNVFNFVLPCWPTPIHSSPFL
nr:hypothetical protein CFP56_59515 [Quercus suber]